MTNKRGISRRAAPVPATVSRPELLIGGGDGAFRHFVHGLLAWGERLFAVRAGFGEVIGLSGIQYTVLVSIAHLQHLQAVGVNTIASHLHLSGAFITTVTNQLVKLGFIRKRRDPQDKRAVVLALTPTAKRALERLAPLQRQVNDELFSQISRPHFEELSRVMDSWIESGDRAVVLLDYLRRNSSSAASR
jgi:DNA-binding MarR family transcriptional regulator